MKKVKKYRLRKKNNIVITKSNNDLVYLRNLIHILNYILLHLLVLLDKHFSLYGIFKEWKK